MPLQTSPAKNDVDPVQINTLLNLNNSAPFLNNGIPGIAQSYAGSIATMTGLINNSRMSPSPSLSNAQIKGRRQKQP
jgi:hypothetical protein